MILKGPGQTTLTFVIEISTSMTSEYESQVMTQKGRTCLIVVYEMWSGFVGYGLGLQCLFVGGLMSQQHASVSQGQICSDNFTCCQTEIEIVGPTFHLTQSLNTDTGPTSPSADPITPGAWQGSHWSTNLYVTCMTRPGKNSARARFKPGIFRSRGRRRNH